MSGKYDSFRDSALHFLCESDWSEDSFGDVNDYGVYIWKISNEELEVATDNGEFNSLIEQWQNYGDADTNSDDFRSQLVGHFIVSENAQGFVNVQKFETHDGMEARYADFYIHYVEWWAANPSS